jgi:hypothetical protein
MDWRQVDLQIVSCGKDRLPDVGRAVVLWSSDDTHIDRMFDFREASLPFNPYVCAEKHICSTVLRELLLVRILHRRLQRQGVIIDAAKNRDPSVASSLSSARVQGC